MVQGRTVTLLSKREDYVEKLLNNSYVFVYALNEAVSTSKYFMWVPHYLKYNLGYGELISRGVYDAVPILISYLSLPLLWLASPLVIVIATISLLFYAITYA